MNVMEGGLDDCMYHRSCAQGAGTPRYAVNGGLYLQVVLVARTRQGSRSILLTSNEKPVGLLHSLPIP